MVVGHYAGKPSAQSRASRYLPRANLRSVREWSNDRQFCERNTLNKHFSNNAMQRHLAMLSAFNNDDRDITNITVGGKRRKQFLFDSELMDSNVMRTSHHGQDKRPDVPTGPVARPTSPNHFDSEEHDFWQQDEVTPEEYQSLPQIILNPAMHELRGTTEQAILAKWHMLAGHINSKYLKQISHRIPGMEEVSRLPSKVKLPVCKVCNSNRGKSKHQPLQKKTLK